VVRVKQVTTPLWVRAIVVALLVGAPGWWLLRFHDRRVNEHRLAAVASVIAGRPVSIHCPGPIAGALAWDFLEGSVQFDSQGRPSDTADLRAGACAELDAFAEGRRRGVLECLGAGRADCGQAAVSLAMAVDVVTHESFHLSGILDEADTECHSLKTMAWTAERLGATPAQASALAWLELHTNYQLMPDRYRSPACDITRQ
jgi:hypothetical protein